MKTTEENQIKADAINNFVSAMIRALESGSVDKNNPTLAEIHRVAHHHVNDNYGIKLPTIVEQWGEDVAKECAKNKIIGYLTSDTDEGIHEAADSSSLEETKILRDRLIDESPSSAFTIYAELDA